MLRALKTIRISGNRFLSTSGVMGKPAVSSFYTPNQFSPLPPVNVRGSTRGVDAKTADAGTADGEAAGVRKTDLSHPGYGVDGKAADGKAIGASIAEMRAKFLLGPQWNSFVEVYDVEDFMHREPTVNYPGLGYYRENALQRAAIIISMELACRNRGWNDEQLQHNPLLELECERIAAQIEDICLSGLELGLLRPEGYGAEAPQTSAEESNTHDDSPVYYFLDTGVIKKVIEDGEDTFHAANNIITIPQTGVTTGVLTEYWRSQLSVVPGFVERSLRVGGASFNILNYEEQAISYIKPYTTRVIFATKDDYQHNELLVLKALRLARTAGVNNRTLKHDAVDIQHVCMSKVLNGVHTTGDYSFERVYKNILNEMSVQFIVLTNFDGSN